MTFQEWVELNHPEYIDEAFGTNTRNISPKAVLGSVMASGAMNPAVNKNTNRNMPQAGVHASMVNQPVQQTQQSNQQQSPQQPAPNTQQNRPLTRQELSQRNVNAQKSNGGIRGTFKQGKFYPDVEPDNSNNTNTNIR